MKKKKYILFAADTIHFKENTEYLLSLDVSRNSDLPEKRLFQPDPKISGRIGINRLSPFARDNNYKYYVLFLFWTMEGLV